WSEPGSAGVPSPTPIPRQPSSKPVESTPSQESQLLPSPIPSRSPTQSATPRPAPGAKPSPTLSLSPLQTPTPVVTPTSTPALVRSPTASPTVPQAGAKSSRLEEITQGSTPESLLLSSPARSLRDVLEEAPLPKSSGAPPSPATAPQGVKSKDQMIAQFKKQ